MSYVWAPESSQKESQGATCIMCSNRFEIFMGADSSHKESQGVDCIVFSNRFEIFMGDGVVTERVPRCNLHRVSNRFEIFMGAGGITERVPRCNLYCLMPWPQKCRVNSRRLSRSCLHHIWWPNATQSRLHAALWHEPPRAPVKPGPPCVHVASAFAYPTNSRRKPRRGPRRRRSRRVEGSGFWTDLS